VVDSIEAINLHLGNLDVSLHEGSGSSDSGARQAAICFRSRGVGATQWKFFFHVGAFSFHSAFVEIKLKQILALVVTSEGKGKKLIVMHH
jgi:hypothetical protein